MESDLGSVRGLPACFMGIYVAGFTMIATRAFLLTRAAVDPAPHSSSNVRLEKFRIPGHGRFR